MSFAKFMTEYWYFIVSGLLVLGLITYWVVEFILAKNQKRNNPVNYLAQDDSASEPVAENEEKPAENEPTVNAKEILPVEETESEEKTAGNKESTVKEEEPQEETKETSLGAYLISYDKENAEWVVKRNGSKRASKRTKTKDEALDYVKNVSETQDVGFVVKKKNGKFQKK